MEKQVNRTTNDLISRAETVRMIEEGKKYQQDADDIAEMIYNMPSAQQWHTGEPTESGDYLCYVKYDIEHGYEVCAYYETDGSFEGDYAGWQSYGIVLAWMPLPEAPEVEE